MNKNKNQNIPFIDAGARVLFFLWRKKSQTLNCC